MRFTEAIIIVSTLALFGTARAELVSHWKLDGDLLDSGPAGNHGSFLAGVPVFVEGFDGTAAGAVAFNLDDPPDTDIISAAYTSGLPISAQPAYSVAMWVKGLPQLDLRVFSEGSSTSGTPLFNIGTDSTAAPNTTGRVDIFIRTDGNSQVVAHRKSARLAYDGNWHHLAWTDDNGKAILYLDGIRDATDFNYTRGTLTRNRTSIGGILRANPGSYFHGTIDEVRIYDHALSEGEVLALVPEPPGCPAEGDTHLAALDVAGPPGGVAGQYTATATAADDGSDPLQYTFVFEKADGSARIQVGPQPGNTAQANLTLGTWNVRVTADDDLACRDLAPDASATKEVTVVAPPDLVSHWKLDGNLLDARPSANHGTFVGDVGPTFVEGYDGTSSGAVSFDGVDDYVTNLQKASLPIYNSSSRAYSVALWVKGPPGQSDRRVFSEASTANTTPLFNIGTQNPAPPGGKVDLYLRTDSNQVLVNHRLSDRDAFDDRWHHLAWVDDDGRAVLYLDGIRDATDFNYTRGALTLNSTTFGGILRGTPCCWFQGAVDDVRLYNYALSEAEVLALVPEPPGCPAGGDTDCAGLQIQAPGGNSVGTYRATITATDGSGDSTLYYTFVFSGPAGERYQSGPRTQDFAEFLLTPGLWTVEATVDDDLACRDRSAGNTCSKVIEVLTEPARLVSRYALDGNLLDSETSANHGVFLGEAGPLFTDGYDCAQNGALALDGIDDLVQAQHVSGLPISIRPRFSISMWVKGPSGQVDRRVFSESSPTNRQILFNLGTDFEGLGGSADILIRGDDGTAAVNHLRSTGTVFDDAWHHLVYHDDQGQAALYIDGVRDPVMLSYTRPALTPSVTTIGGILRDDRSHWFQGSIDEVRIYNYVLSEAEIAELYGAGAEPSCCPVEGDTTCTGLEVSGPEGGGPGAYLASAAAADGSGDAILYTFTAGDGVSPPQTKGPQTENTASFDLVEGNWTISVTVDDDPDCSDQSPANSCSQEVFVCPGEGDTLCTGLEVVGPGGRNGPGLYTATASATDDSGNSIRYTFSASGPAGDPPLVVGPQSDRVASFNLTPGTWTISVRVDDDPLCQDQAEGSFCVQEVVVVEPGVGPFRRGDVNADGVIDVTDAVGVFGWLFLGDEDPPCLAAVNPNGEAEITLTSGVYLLSFLFLGGPDPIGPYPDCGRSTLAVDVTLGCRSFPPCEG